MPDERHPLDQLLVGAHHAVQPPAVILAPRVGGSQRPAFVVGRRRAVQHGGAVRARERLHGRFDRLARERLGLPGRRAEARPPQQPASLRGRQLGGDRRRRHGRGRGRVGGDRRRRRGSRQSRGARRGRGCGWLDVGGGLLVVLAAAVMPAVVVLAGLRRLAVFGPRAAGGGLVPGRSRLLARAFPAPAPELMPRPASLAPARRVPRWPPCLPSARAWQTAAPARPSVGEVRRLYDARRARRRRSLSSAPNGRPQPRSAAGGQPRSARYDLDDGFDERRELALPAHVRVVAFFERVGLAVEPLRG